MIETQPQEIDKKLIRLLTPEQAGYLKAIPYLLESNTLSVFVDEDAYASNLENELEFITHYNVNLITKDTGFIESLLSKYYRKTTGTPSVDQNADFIDSLVNEAKSTGSSDIHIEPKEHNGIVRLRMDGKLVERMSIKKTAYLSLINQIKIRANLDISEKRLPQDGRIHFKQNNESLDLRVSTLPTLYGEKVVMRLLSRDAGFLSLDRIGMSAQDLEKYKSALFKTNGVILISGPTGSGKTTTLYATLKHLNNESTNILTIEDPIEYTLEGINQVQLKENIGLDFPSALKTFLRQDPDIIMVGEIRDPATAQMAIRASLTGHLVLSTIHTNSAWDTITRLQDMDVPSFLISSTLNLSIAQRLVRKLCSKCSVDQAEYDPETLRSLGYRPPEKVKKAVGCEDCFFTGYKGRQAIYEVLIINDQVSQQIKSPSKSKTEIYKENGVKSLGEQALLLIRNGIISVEEALPHMIE